VSFNKKLRNLRKKSNMSVNELAQKIGLSNSSIRMYETGDRIPPADILIKIAKTFGVSSDYLLDLDTEDNKNNVLDLIILIDTGVYEKYCNNASEFYLRHENLIATIETVKNKIALDISDLSSLDFSYIDLDINATNSSIKKFMDDLDTSINKSQNLIKNLETIDKNYDEIKRYMQNNSYKKEILGMMYGKFSPLDNQEIEVRYKMLIRLLSMPNFNRIELN
jgi:transcriptional regulator with XRE-family HTH domain